MDKVAFEELAPTMSEEARSALIAADIVLGVDRQSHVEYTVFGLPALESTATLKKPSAMRTLKVTLNCEKTQLEQLLVLIRRVKGLDN